MRVLKKNGLTEEFDITKVKTSIANSAYDIKLHLTESDLKMLLQEIKKKLCKLENDSLVTSSCEIRIIIYYVLIDCGFPKIAKSYMDVDI